MYFNFTENDKFVNTLVTYPDYEIVIDPANLWINNRINQGANVLSSSLSVHEINVNRLSGLIYPYLPKGGDYERLGTITADQFHSASYGTHLTGTYPITSSIKITNYTDMTDPKVASLYNIIGNYKKNNQLMDFDVITANNDLTILEIPRLFVGSSIKKGSIQLEFYFTGTLLSKIDDSRMNGDLIISDTAASYAPSFISGSTVIGSVLYDEGILLLNSTGSLTEWSIADRTTYIGGDHIPMWTDFGVYTGDATVDEKFTYRLKFKGVNKVPTLTMFCYAPKFHLNNSVNPTFISRDASFTTSSTNAKSFVENEFMDIKNLASSSYAGVTSSFEKITRISKIGIYNEDKKLIGIAKLANPLIKKEEQDYTFKIKLDL